MNTELTNYGVKNKFTGKFFGGFGASGETLWVNERSAQRMERAQARLQAILLQRFAGGVQQKPVAL